MKIEVHDLVAAHRRVRCVSGRGAGQIADVFKERYEDGLTSVNSVGSSTVRALITKLNKTLESNFDSVPCEEFSKTDGSAVVCNDIGELLRKIVWIQGKPFGAVAIIRFNLDGGTGNEVRLWVSWSYIDDPRFYGEAPDNTHGPLDTGSNRIYCVTAVPGAKESHALVQWACNNQRIAALWKFFQNAEIVWSNDMKVQLLQCGLQGAGSRYSSIYAFFSQWSEYSRPNEERTAHSILSDNCDRLAEEKENGTVT